jgi:hypothetical protein
MGGTLAAALLSGAAWAQTTPPRSAPDADAAQVRQAMIRASIAGYPGNCPCPYSIMRNGRNCGSRSAYSKPGGATPLCYPRDISDAMVEQYRKGR